MRLSNLLPLAATASATIYYAGVAESGGEFGVYSPEAINGTGLPGTFGVDYAFLNASTVPIWVQQNKINLFRVAFLLERMCPLENGLGSTFNETYFSEYQAAIETITTAGAYAIIDPHNYMRDNDPSQQPFTGSIIGNIDDPAAATTQQFGEFWNELAGRFKDNEHVIFAIMNEPHDMPTRLIFRNDQAAINGIRATGAKQMILAPGNCYTGGHSFTQDCDSHEASSLWMHRLHDPANNTAIDLHEYLDPDWSASSMVCNQSYPEDMAEVTAWLRKNNLKAFVSEFGGANNTQCYEYLTQAVNYMESNPEYIGWSYWAAGPLWGVWSGCCTDGNHWGSIEPGSVAIDGSPGLYETVWLKVMQGLVPNTLQRSGISNIHGSG